MSEVETVEEVVFEGVAGSINDVIVALEAARNCAVKFEGGLDTKAAIKDASVCIRNILIGASKDLRAEFGAVLGVRDELLESVADVQKDAKIAALKKKMQEDAAALAALEG